MILFADLKTELCRSVDDTSIGSTNQGAYVNQGYRYVRKKIAQIRPHEFESVKTTIAITSGVGPLPATYMWMVEVQDVNETYIPQLRRNILADADTGSTVLYWYMVGRTASAGHTKQIGIKPVITTSIYAYFIPLAADLTGAADELIDLPDEEAQHIGLIYSSYLYYRDKRRWSDAGNALQLFQSMLTDYLEEFVDDEEEYIDDGSTNFRPRFRFHN